MKRFFLIIILIFLIPITFASTTLTYNLNEGDVLFSFYQCGNTCNALEFIETKNSNGNSLSYNYNENIKYLVVGYKECYYPVVKEVDPNNFENGDVIDLTINKRNLCSADVSKEITLKGELKPKNNISVKAKILSPFLRKDFSNSNFLDNLETNTEYFTAKVNVQFYVNNELISAKSEDLFNGQEKIVEFFWVPESGGNYNLKILTNVNDCQCLSSSIFERSIDVVINGDSSRVFSKIEPTCERGDGCKLNCINGDSDCSCEIQKGFICSAEYECKGTSLKNFDGRNCCSQGCIKSDLNGENSVVRLFVNDKPKDKPLDRQKQNQIKKINNSLFEKEQPEEFKLNFNLILLIIIISVVVGLILTKFNSLNRN